MSKVGIKFTEQAVFTWAEYVTSLAEKMGKSEREKRVKYLNGFPSSFDVVVVSERQKGAIGSYSHPATYPAHDPRLAQATADAAVHTATAATATANGDAAAAAIATAAAAKALEYPNAGEPDLFATAHGFYPEWARMTKQGMIKSVPRGMANQAQDTSSGEDENPESASLASALLARARVSLQTVCLVCGGIGHAANVDGFGKCLTARLGHRVPPSDLSRIQYPDGYTPPRFGDRNSNRPRTDSHPHTRPPDPRRRYQPNTSHSHARAIETDPNSYDSHGDYCDSIDTMTPDEITELAARINAEQARRRRYNDRPRPVPRRPTPRRHVQFSRPRARKTEEHEDEHTEETQQNSTSHDADDYEDPEEHHGRLAVAFDAIDF